RPALLALGVAPPRLFGRAAADGDRRDRDHPLELADVDGELVAAADVFRRLHARPVQLDAPAVDRLGGEAARLEEARGPEPLVDAEALGRFAHWGVWTRATV